MKRIIRDSVTGATNKPKNAVWVKDGQDMRWKIFKGTNNDTVDPDFLSLANKRNHANYIDVIVVPNGTHPNEVINSSSQNEYEYRKNIYLKRKHEFETLGEDDNNDVLSREEKMNIAKAEMDRVNPKSVKSAKDATFKNDKRLSPTSERYKGYLIVLDRGGDGYNVYDKHRELEDAGYPSKEAAKNFIDELVAYDNDIYSSTNSEYALFKKTYSHSREFKDKDKQSGSIRDLIDELENKDISYEIYDNKTDNGCTVFYDDDGTVTAASYGRSFDIEDDQYSDWRELASKSVEDSDGFNTDYTLYTNGETYICMFGDKELYEPDEEYADYETENEQDAWDWFNSYTGFADEEDEYDIYGSEDLESDFNEYEDDIQEISQEFTSENTSINSTKLPAVFKMVSFEPGTTNIDYGGGRFDNVADYLTQYDVINLVYDPYNRTPEHNKEVIKTLRRAGGADTATCSNVLNVIKEPEVRKNVLENISKIVKPGGKVYITVYEGSGKGDEGPTKAGYQLNRRTADYLDEIREVFPDANRKGKLIVATNSRTVNSSTHVASDEICKAISGDKSAIQSLKKQGYKINRLANPVQISEVGTYEIIDPTTGETYNYDNTLSYYANTKVNASQSYLDRIEELMEQGLDEETASREAYAEFYPDEYDADDYDEIYSANYGGRYYVDDKYIDSSTDITAASKLWMGKYKSAKDNKMHKVYFEFDTSDFEEAEQEFEGIIPEPYSYARLLGTAPHEALLQKDGFEKIQSSSTVVTAASSGKLDKYMNVTKDRKKYAVHYTEVNTDQDAWTIYSDFRAQVSKISPYDDADYAWADIRNGHIDVIRNGKVVKRSYYFNADDMDVENTEWCDIIIDEAIDLIAKINKDIEPRMVYNSTSIASKNKSSITSSADKKIRPIDELDDVTDQLRDDLIQKLMDVMSGPNFGFTRTDVLDYSRVDIRFDDDENRIEVEVGAEVDYDGLMQIAQDLDPIIQSYDEAAYFDAEDAGLLIAVIPYESLRKHMKVNSASDLPEPSLDPPEYDDPEEVDEDVTVEFDMDRVRIDVDKSGSWEYIDDSFLDDVLTDDDTLYSEEYDVEVRDRNGLLEDLDDILKYDIPVEAGEYRISCHITLVYHITGIEKYDKYPDDNYGDSSEYSTENAEVKFDFHDSYVEDFRIVD